jgi:hypothetical protein
MAVSAQPGFRRELSTWKVFASNDASSGTRGGSFGLGVELGAQREGLFQVLDEDAYFRGHTAAGRPHGKDRHSPLEGRQQTENGTLPQFGGKEPGRRLGNPQVLEHAHPHLLGIAGSESAGGNDALCVRPAAEGPWLDRATLGEDY